MAGGHTIVENMRHGMSPEEAVMDVMKRVAHNFGDDRDRLQKIGIQFYALRKDGKVAGGSLWDRGGSSTAGPTFVVNDGGVSRREPCVSLLAR